MAVERVLRVVAQPYVVDPAAGPVQVTASMGATVYPIDRSDADTCCATPTTPCTAPSSPAATATCSSTPNTAAAPKSA
jgi:hypothetical protein